MLGTRTRVPGGSRPVTLARRYGGLLVAAAVLALSTGTGAVPRAATTTTPPDGMDQATYARVLAQIPLDAAADQIQQAAARPGAGHDGFVETSVDTNQHSVTVYWHGALPPDISKIVDTLRHEVTVKVAPARLSLSELNAAVSAGSGIEPDFARHARSVSATDLTASVGMPVQTGIATSAAFTPICNATGLPALAAPSRCDDRSPFWGGDVVLNKTSGESCSSAFGVHNAAGRRYLVIAAHCSDDGLGNLFTGIEFDDGDMMQFIGTSVFVSGPYDAALIIANAGSGARYYDGAGIEFGDTHNKKVVVNQQGVSVGDSYCESGAFTGVSCGWTVVGVNEGNVPNCPGSGFAEAVSTNVLSLVRGDSGGPVFALAGSSTVSARGVIDCAIRDRTGHEHMWFTPMSTVSATTGTTVNT